LLNEAKLVRAHGEGAKVAGRPAAQHVIRDRYGEQTMPKMKSRTAPLRRAGDSMEMRAAVDQLQSQGVGFIRPTPFQLKIGDINFYPDKGTIYLDDRGKALKERGLPVLLEILARLRERNQATDLVLEFRADLDEEEKLFKSRNAGLQNGLDKHT
jgi:hypothetical protein